MLSLSGATPHNQGGGGGEGVCLLVVLRAGVGARAREKSLETSEKKLDAAISLFSSSNSVFAGYFYQYITTTTTSMKSVSPRETNQLCDVCCGYLVIDHVPRWPRGARGPAPSCSVPTSLLFYTIPWPATSIFPRVIGQ